MEIQLKQALDLYLKCLFLKVDHFKDAVVYMQAPGINIITVTEKTNQTIYDMSFKGPCAIIMGSEYRGINPSILKIVDAKAKLPILGKIKGVVRLILFKNKSKFILLNLKPPKWVVLFF